MLIETDTQGELARRLGMIMPERRDDEPAPPLVALQIAQAVTNAKVDEVGRLVNELRQEVRELKSTFVTKSELDPIRADLKELQDWQKWIFRGILTMFLTGIGAVIWVKGGVPHP